MDSATLLTTGVWHHLAAVRGSNFTQLYVNGHLERQMTVSFPYPRDVEMVCDRDCSYVR
jgi:hypothetical protein